MNDLDKAIVDRIRKLVESLDGSRAAYKRAFDEFYELNNASQSYATSRVFDEHYLVPMAIRLFQDEQADPLEFQDLFSTLCMRDEASVALGHPMLPFYMADMDNDTSRIFMISLWQAYSQGLEDAFRAAYKTWESSMANKDFAVYVESFLLNVPDGVQLPSKVALSVNPIQKSRKDSSPMLYVSDSIFTSDITFYQMLTLIEHWESVRGPSVRKPKARSVGPIYIPPWKHLPAVRGLIGSEGSAL